MHRRSFLAGLTSVVAAPQATHAQPAGRPHRIGVLALPPREVMAAFIEPFAEGLRRLGYVDGQDFVIEYRVADWKRWRLPGLARELVQLGVDVILTGTNPITDVAKRATTTIPIVMVLGSDPVRQGLVDSLARPVGNVTGLAFDAAAETYAKPFQFLREAMPQISRVAVVWNPDLWSRDLSGPLQKIADESTAKMAIGVQYLKFAGPTDLKPVFDAMRVGRATAAPQTSNGRIGRSTPTIPRSDDNKDAMIRAIALSQKARKERRFRTYLWGIDVSAKCDRSAGSRSRRRSTAAAQCRS